MPTIPAPVRACLGLIDATVHRARDLAEHAPELPMLVVGNALQMSMRAQQRFTDLTIRGDELIGRLRGVPDEPPPWATFDEDLPTPSRPAEPAIPATKAPATKAPATKAPTPAKKTPAKKAPAKKAPAKKTPAKKVPQPAADTKPLVRTTRASSLAADLIADSASVQTPGSARQLSAFDLAADPGAPGPARTD